MDGKKKLQKLNYEQVQKTDTKIILANPYNHIFFLNKSPSVQLKGDLVDAR